MFLYSIDQLSNKKSKYNPLFFYLCVGHCPKRQLSVWLTKRLLSENILRGQVTFRKSKDCNL